MKDNFNLTPEQNMFLAKKTLAESVYNSARLEGVNITFPDIQTIINGVVVPGIDTDDLQIVLNLRNAWRFVLSNILSPFTLDFACRVNGFVSYNESLEWGVLRRGNVGITGVKYKPSIPVASEVVKDIDDILSSNLSMTEKAIRYMLYGMRSQLFWDGNKRTSTLCANKLLIQNGKGIISIEEHLLPEFHRKLSSFYESGDYSKIDTFIYEKCLHGITF